VENNLAVLIDFENVAAGAQKEGLGRFDVSLVMDRFKEKGRILVARSYADWGRFARFKKGLLMEGVQLFELTSHGMNDKNRADVALVVDCMELAFTKDYVDTYVIISGDSDFTPLVMKLKEMNKRVIGCGTRRSTSRLIVEACDEFVFYDSLAREQSNKKVRTRKTREAEPTATTEELSLEDSLELLVDTLGGIRRESAGAIHGSRLKQAMLRKEPTFSETDLGYSSFMKFLENCQEEGLIRLDEDGKAGGYRVDLLDSNEAQEESPFGFSDGPRDLYLRLRHQGIEALTPDLKQEVIDAVVEHMADRERRKRRATVAWVAEDVARLVRKQHPELKARLLRSVVMTMHRAGAFVHSDGAPVRSATATCVLKADPLKLRGMVDAVMIKALIQDGVDLAANSSDVAALLLGSPDRSKEVEILAAWELTVPDDEPVKAAEEPSDATEGAEAAQADGDDKPKKRRRSRRKKKDETETEVAAAAQATVEAPAEAAPTAEIAPAAEAAPTAEIAPAAEVAPTAEAAPAEVAAEPVAVVADDAEPADAEPRKPRRRKVRSKKTDEPTPAAE
jgi:hypothetical protein